MAKKSKGPEGGPTSSEALDKATPLKEQLANLYSTLKSLGEKPEDEEHANYLRLEIDKVEQELLGTGVDSKDLIEIIDKIDRRYLGRKDSEESEVPEIAGGSGKPVETKNTFPKKEAIKRYSESEINELLKTHPYLEKLFIDLTRAQEIFLGNIETSKSGKGDAAKFAKSRHQVDELKETIYQFLIERTPAEQAQSLAGQMAQLTRDKAFVDFENQKKEMRRAYLENLKSELFNTLKYRRPDLRLKDLYPGEKIKELKGKLLEEGLSQEEIDKIIAKGLEARGEIPGLRADKLKAAEEFWASLSKKG